MNRGLQFFTPTIGEWYDYNVKILNRSDDIRNGGDLSSTSGVYVSTNTMPAFVLNLTRPHLNWCIDTSLLSRNETKINIGSSYFITDRCVLGPRVCCWNASVDKRASMYVESFAKEVSNGLRWILQIYRSTNIMQQYDLFNTDLDVAKNIRNKLAFGTYTPIRLVTPLKDGIDCEEVPMSANGDSPFFVQPYGFSCDRNGPNGGAGQFTRPYLGAAPVTGFCSAADTSDLAVKDPYVLNANDVRTLNELISRNREKTTNMSPGIFKPSSGISNINGSRISGGITSDADRNTARIPVGNATGVNFQHDSPSTPRSSSNRESVTTNGVPQPPHPSTVGDNYTDVDMDDTIRQFVGMD